MVLQPVEKRIWQHPSATRSAAVAPKCPTGGGAAAPAPRPAAEATGDQSGGRPLGSNVTPTPAITAPAPSDDMSRPKPCAPSFSTSFATSGTTTLKLSTSKLATTSSARVKAVDGVRAV